MHLFLDTEFTDFTECDLISLGVVSEDGQHEFYVEITDHTVEWQSDFVKQIVVPLLDNEKHGMIYNEAGVKLAEWIETLPSDDLIFLIDYGGDGLLFGELLRNCVVNKSIKVEIIEVAFKHWLHANGFHMPQQLHEAFKGLLSGMEDYFEDVDSRRHHALVDAKSNRHGWLKGFEYAKRV